MQETSSLPETIRARLEAHDWLGLARLRGSWPPPHHVAAELADLLRRIEPSDRAQLFRALPQDVAGDVFAELDHDLRDRLVEDLSDVEHRQLLADLAPDDRAQVLSSLPGRATQRLLNLLDPAQLHEVRQLLGYPEDSVGRLMTPRYLAVKRHWRVGRALDHVRERGKASEMTHVVYVVDERWRLVDTLDLAVFVFADDDAPVSSVMDSVFISIGASADREEAVHLMQRHDLVALPVVDEAKVLLGIVTFDDVMDVAEDEATEDFHLSAAVQPLPGGYFATGVQFLYRARVGWLALLVVVNLLSSGVIAAFEDTLTAVVALAFFIPLIIDTGGNAGAQAATLMVRALSTRDVSLRDWKRVLGKEALVGLALGSTLGLLGAMLGAWRGGPEIGLVVFLTMITMIVVTNLIGLLLPFVLTVFRKDPAIASGPLVTSLADAAGLLIYFSFAALILGDVSAAA